MAQSEAMSPGSLPDQSTGVDNHPRVTWSRSGGAPRVTLRGPRGWSSPDDPCLSVLDEAPNEIFPPLTESTRRYDVFRQFGSFTMAYATLQPGIRHFEAYGGYLAYEHCGKTTFVLGDPVAPIENHPALIEAFLREYPRTCFCQISRATGAILSRLGWFVNEFGTDMELDLATYDFAGPKKSKFRQAAHKIEREGYTLEEEDPAGIDERELDLLNSSWIAGKRVRHEARFLVRPLSFGEEGDVRRFFLRSPEGHVVSYVGFDPICENGETIGYSPAIKRRSPSAPTGAEEAVTMFAIGRFQMEGRKLLRLGLLPLYDVQDSAFREVWLLKKFFQWLYWHGDRWIYSFRGHADFKHRYRGRLEKVYFATWTRWNMWNLLALLRLCRLR